MRALFVIPYYPPYAIGGAEESTFELTAALRERGHEIDVLAPRHGDLPPTIDGVHTIDLGLPSFREGEGVKTRAFDSPGAVRRLAAAIKEAAVGADVVHCHGLPVLPGSFLGARRAGVPIVATVRDLGAVCPVSVCLLDHARVPTDCGILKLHRECVPRFTELYGGSRARVHLGSTTGFAAARGRAALLRRCDAVVFVGQDLADLHEEAGLVAGNQVVIPNIATLLEPSRTRRADASPYALYAGKISHGKGIPVLLAALARLRASNPELRVIVAGWASDAWRAQLEAAPAIEYVGRVDRGTLANLYAGARFAVVPSVWPEPLPRAVLEAAYAGVPTIGAESGGIPEAIEDGVTGLLVPPRDAEALAAAMSDLWKDPSRAAALGERGRTRALTRFSRSVVCPAVEALYADVSARGEATARRAVA